MDDNTDYIELVEKAQLGDKESLNRLADAAKVRLYQYVQRLTLQEDLTEDIVQETITEMFKVFEKLKKTESFWPWLHGIAFNKVRSHYGRQWRHKTVSLSDPAAQLAAADSGGGLADMVTAELKQIVFQSMRRLQPRHRAVLTMRCYDGLKYSEIAKLMDSSEFAVQALFYRAKKALSKELGHRGLGKGWLVPALLLFGKLTASSEAAAANVSVTAATIKVGAAATVAVLATSKIAVVSLATAGVIAAGSVAVVPQVDKIDVGPRKCKAESFLNSAQPRQASKTEGQCWYYYPPNGNGAVLMQFKSGTDGKQSYCQWLQNDQANYYRHKNTIYIRNYRMWSDDLTVQRLPTDSRQLRDFLSRVEGRSVEMKYVSGSTNSLLVIAKQNENGEYSQITHRYDVSDEEYFRYNWPAGTRTIDNRDAMHCRGWTYFTVEGEVNGREIWGTGRLPFVYAESGRHRPWLRLKVGGKLVVDSGDGRLFKGLSRPWMGLHTIDTVRRDAAESRVWFETELLGGGKAEVTLTHNQTRLVYTIDMEADVINKITFSASDGSEGELRFSYLQEIDNLGSEFVAPRQKSYRRPQETRGMLWLLELISDN